MGFGVLIIRGGRPRAGIDRVLDAPRRSRAVGVVVEEADIFDRRVGRRDEPGVVLAAEPGLAVARDGQVLGRRTLPLLGIARRRRCPPIFQITSPVVGSMSNTASRYRMDTSTSPKYGLEVSSSIDTELQW